MAIESFITRHMHQFNHIRYENIQLANNNINIQIVQFKKSHNFTIQIAYKTNQKLQNDEHETCWKRMNISFVLFMCLQ